MQTSDVPMLVTYMKEMWPHYATPSTEDEYAVRVQAWMDVLGDLDLNEVRAAIAMMASREYAPSPGQIREAVASFHHRQLPDWDEFWRWARGIASRVSLYVLNDRPSFECPWPELEGLVRLDDFMAGDVPADAADLDQVVQAHLRRRFESATQRVRSGNVGPPPILERIGLSVDRALGSGEPRRLLPVAAVVVDE